MMSSSTRSPGRAGLGMISGASGSEVKLDRVLTEDCVHVTVGTSELRLLQDGRGADREN